MWGTMFEAIVIWHNSFLRQKDINLKQEWLQLGKVWTTLKIEKKSQFIKKEMEK